ncbi:MAG TPA: EamA family transporter [Anaerolineales bacterium]|nr:EamA family transporter [Anaerolineales bacterium]
MALYALGVFLSALSQVLLKVSADRNWPNRFRVYANKYVGGAYGLMLLSFALSSLALRDMRASLAPVIESASFIFVLVFGRVLFRDSVKVRQVLGVILIVLGMIVFGL